MFSFSEELFHLVFPPALLRKAVDGWRGSWQPAKADPPQLCSKDKGVLLPQQCQALRWESCSLSVPQVRSWYGQLRARNSGLSSPMVFFFCSVRMFRLNFETSGFSVFKRKRKNLYILSPRYRHETVSCISKVIFLSPNGFILYAFFVVLLQGGMQD